MLTEGRTNLLHGVDAAGDFLDGDNATAATVDAPHSVQKETRNPDRG